MTINLADNSPRVSYAVAEGVTQSSFTVSFEFFEDADLNVYVDGTLKTLTTDYTVSGGDGSTGSVAISVTGVSGGSTVVITRSIALERTTDFPSSGPFDIASLNTELDKVIGIAADLDDEATRGLRLKDQDEAVSTELPLKADRLGKVLAFNATTGVPEAGPTIADTQSLADITADIATLADIEDGTDATDAIQTVSGISANVTTVAGVSSDVSTVAGISSDVTTVAGDATDIATVAGDSADIQTLADISSDITTAAGISANITTVAGDSTDIQALADVTTEIGLLGTADAIADMNTLATSAIVTDMDALADLNAEIDALGDVTADITTVAGIESDVTTVAGISANTTTVAGIASNVTTVAGISANTTTVAGISANVTTVAGISSDVTTVAGDSADISTVAGVSTEIGRLGTADAVADMNTLGTADVVADMNTLGTAAIVADMGTLADISANITTVAGISSDVTTVAGDSADISTVAGISSDVSTVATNNSNVTTVASNITGVNSFAERYRVGASDPTTSLDEGDLFFNTTDNGYKFYDGSAWQTVNVSGIGNVSEDTTPELGGDLSTSGNDINFGDSDKAVFGDDGELEIFSNGTTAIISETGGGDLYIKGASTRLLNPAGNKAYFVGTDGVESTIYYNGQAKLATTSTGVDVTGTVTADGLTVDGSVDVNDSNLNITSNAVNINLYENDTTDVNTRIRQSAGDLFIQTLGDTSGVTNRNNLDHATGDISFYANDGTTQGLFWDASTQRLGLGTTSPVRTLHAESSSNLVGRFESTGSTEGFIQLAGSGTGTAPRIGATANNLVAYTSDAERMRIDSSGNVGIGSTSPNANLHIAASNQSTGSRGNLYIATTDAYAADKGGQITFGGRYFDNPADTFFGSIAGRKENANESNVQGYLSFATRATAGNEERMRITSGGNVGIGIDSPSAGLHIDNPDNSAITAILDTDNSAVKIVFRNNTETGNNVQIGADGSALVANTGGSERMRITSGGGLGIGKTAAGESQASGSGYFFAPGSAGYSSHVQTASTGNYLSYLHRNGTSGGMILFKNNDSSIGSITNSTTGITYNTTSDIRLKTDIAPIADATDKLMAMNAVTHKWKADPDADAVVGFIAQEMAEIVPEAVSGDANSDEMMSMDYGRITPVLVAALQDAHKKIEQLEQRINEMETE